MVHKIYRQFAETHNLKPLEDLDPSFMSSSFSEDLLSFEGNPITQRKYPSLEDQNELKSP